MNESNLIDFNHAKCLCQLFNPFVHSAVCCGSSEGPDAANAAVPVQRNYPDV